MWPRRIVGGVLALGLAACAGCGTAQPPQRATLTGAETVTSGSGQSSQEPQITPEPTGGPTPVAGRPWDAALSRTCQDAVGAGFAQQAQSADGGGTTTFWSRGRDWRVCDVAAAARAEPTVFGPDDHRGRGLGVRDLAISTSRTTADGAPGTTRLVAGGLLPWSVDEIRFELPEGESASARFVIGADDPGRTWWVMTHTAPRAALADDDAPVTVSVVGGAAEAFRVPWRRIQRSE
jgi:hypothetical protein